MGEAPKGKAPSAGGAAVVVCVLVAGALILAAVGRGTQSKAPPSPAAPAALPIPADAVQLPQNTLVEWEHEKRPGPATYTSGGLLLTLSDSPGSDDHMPVLEVRSADGRLTRVEGERWMGDASAEIGVGHIDAASAEPQVLFTTFSGGAHCCASTKLVEKLDGAWRVVDLAWQDGDRLGQFPADIDGDGRREFQLADGRFLSAFTSYADSLSPPTVKRVNRGIVEDLSAEPRFRKVFQSYAAEAKSECEKGRNGACAAYVAAAARAGQIEAAWPVMLAAYQRDSDWTLPTACVRKPSSGECAEADTVRFATYPEALRWFLGDTGYLPAIYLPDPASTGPSFGCEPTQTEVLKLICGTPELAKADRELAWAYQRTLALSADWTAAREAQRQFLALRDGSPPDAFTLLRVYQARLEQLNGVLAGL